MLHIGQLTASNIRTPSRLMNSVLTVTDICLEGVYWITMWTGKIGGEFILHIVLSAASNMTALVLVLLWLSSDRYLSWVEVIALLHYITVNMKLLLYKVSAKDAESVYFWIVPESLGQIPVEVKAISSNVAGDAVRRQLLVKVLRLSSAPLFCLIFKWFFD